MRIRPVVEKMKIWYYQNMTTQQLIQKIKKTEVRKIGKVPVVVLPLAAWQEIQDRLRGVGGETWQEVVDFTTIKKGGIQAKKLLAHL